MKMEIVELEHSHAVDNLQKILLRKEISGYIHHESPVFKTGSIIYVHCRYSPVNSFHHRVSADLARQGKTKGLKGIEKSGSGRRIYIYSVFDDLQPIGLCNHGRILMKHNVSLILSHLHFRHKTCRCAEKTGKPLAHRKQSTVPC